MSEHYELARGGCGAGRQRTIAAADAKVAGTVLVAELGDETTVDGARLSCAETSVPVARQRINKPKVTRARSGSGVCTLSPPEARAISVDRFWSRVQECVI